MAKRKSEVPKDEKPTDRVKRVIAPRVGKAIKYIGLVGLTTDAAKLLSPENKQQILGDLEAAVRKVERQFAGKGTTTTGYTLS